MIDSPSLNPKQLCGIQGRAVLFAAVLLIGLLQDLRPLEAQAISGPWRWSNPTPTGMHIYDLASANGFVIQVGEFGGMLTSTNGVLWTPISSGVTNALRSAALFNDRIVVSGEAGLVLYSNGNQEFNRAMLTPPTQSWLESLTFSPTLILAVGDAGAAYASADGVAWEQTSSPGSTWLRGAAYGNGLFVVVGEKGFVATSPDTRQWTKRSSGTSRNLNRVTFGGNRFWAAGDSGTVLASPNGQSWTSINTGAAGQLYTISATALDVVVAGDNELRYGRLSGPASFSWSNVMSSQPTAQGGRAPAWRYFASCPAESGFYLAGSSGMWAVGNRSGGFSPTLVWTTPHESIRNWLWDVTRIGDQYLAVGDFATVLTSKEGQVWDLELVPNSFTNRVLLGVGGGTNMAVAVGSRGSMLISTNTLIEITVTNVVNGQEQRTIQTSGAMGLYWEAIAGLPSTSDLQGIGYDGTQFVVTGGEGTILTSPDARSWQARSSQTTVFLSGVTHYPGGWIAVGDRGTILQSLDGAQWVPRASGTTNWLYRVRYLGETLFAVGEGGALLRSSDGKQWQTIQSATRQWLNDVTKVGPFYVAAGVHGTVLTSRDGIAWGLEPFFTSKSLYGCATREGQLITVGVEGAILRNQILPSTNPVQMSYSFKETAGDGALHSFGFKGVTDQRFALDRSTNLVDWLPGPEFEFYDSEELLFYEEEITPSSSMLFFRATSK